MIQEWLILRNGIFTLEILGIECFILQPLEFLSHSLLFCCCRAAFHPQQATADVITGEAVKTLKALLKRRGRRETLGGLHYMILFFHYQTRSRGFLKEKVYRSTRNEMRRTSK